MNKTDQTKPSMQTWQQAWAASNIENLKNCYSNNGIVIPPNHQRIIGASTIVQFFSGGMEQIEVRFFPEEVSGTSDVVYESGVVRDFEKNTEKIVETCHYSVVYGFENGKWKIKLHTWTIPIEN